MNLEVYRKENKKFWLYVQKFFSNLALFNSCVKCHLLFLGLATDNDKTMSAFLEGHNYLTRTRQFFFESQESMTGRVWCPTPSCAPKEEEKSVSSLVLVGRLKNRKCDNQVYISKSF